MHPKKKGMVSGKGKVLSLTVPLTSGFPMHGAPEW